MRSKEPEPTNFDEYSAQGDGHYTMVTEQLRKWDRRRHILAMVLTATLLAVGDLNTTTAPNKEKRKRQREKRKRQSAPMGCPPPPPPPPAPPPPPPPPPVCVGLQQVCSS